jgi:hypothetical protein
MIGITILSILYSMDGKMNVDGSIISMNIELC